MQISPDLQISDLVQLCEIVYRPDAQADAAAEALGFRNCRHIGNGGPHAMICEDDDRLIVVVRGTQLTDPWDLISDGRVLPKRVPAGGFVHRGFLAHAVKLLAQLPGDIYTRKQLWICGHSLGGAAAALIAAVVGWAPEVAGGTKPNLLTVGAPRIGTRRYLDVVQQAVNQSIRIVNHRDPVPLCVPGYRHPEAMVIHFDRHGVARVNPTWRMRFRDRARGWLSAIPVGLKAGFREGSLSAAVTAGLLHVLPIKNHYVHQYVQLVRDSEQTLLEQREVA